MGMDSVFKVSLVLGMVDNITSKVDSVSNSVQGSVGGMTSAFESMEKAGLAMTSVGTTIAGACLSTATATFETQDALGELASLGVEDLAAVEAAAKSFSDTWAGTAKSDFITAAYDIKSGIASLTDEGVAQFTELAALTGKATKSTTEEMGSLFATGYGIYKDFYSDMSDMEFGEMFSAGISIAVRLYKTSGSQMAEAIGMLGASATNANVPMEEQLAILGQLQTTMGGSEAATKYNAFLQSAAGAGKKLGLTFTDANNQLLSTPEILDILKGKYGETLDAVEKQKLKEAFGTDEAIKYIDLLYGKTDVLRDGIEELYGSMEDGIAVTEGMADAINSTPAQKFEVLKQKIHNTVEELGSGLLPAVNNSLDAVNNLVQKGSDWIANNQETVATIMNIVMYLGIFLIGAGALTAVVGTMGKAFLSLSGIFKGVKSTLGGIGFLSALGPIAAIAAAVIGLIAVFEYCGGDITQLQGIFQSVFGSIGSIISGALGTAAEYLPGFLQFGAELLGSVASGIAGQLPALLDSGSAMILSVALGIAAALPGITESGIELLNSFVAMIVSGLPGLLSAGTGMILSILQGIGILLPSIADMASQLLLGFLNAIVSALPVLLSAGAGMGTSLLQGIIQLLPVLIQSGMSLIISLLQGIVQQLPVIAQSGIALVLQLLSGLAQSTPSLLSAGGQLIVAVLSGILQLLPNLLSGGLAIIGNILSGILQGIPSVVSIGGDIVSAIWGAITETDWLALGGSMISGIAEGFMSGFQSLVDSVKGAWDSFTSWLSGGGDDEIEVAVPTATATPAPAPVTTTAPVVTQTSVTETTSVTMPQMEVNLSGYEQSGADGIAAFTSGFESGTTDAQMAMDSLMSDLAAGLEDGAGNVELTAGMSMDSILEAVNGIDTSQTSAIGNDLMDSIGSGISENAEATAAAAQETISAAMASLGSFDTGATDALGSSIMNSIGTGITGNSSAAITAAEDTSSSIAGAFALEPSELTDGVTRAAETIKATMSSITADVQQGVNCMRSAWQAGMSGIKSAVSSGMTTVRSNAVSQANSIVSQIRAAFSNMKVRIPAPTLPHVSVSYSTVGSGNATAQVPNFSVRYYATGGIMTKPTMFAYDWTTGEKHVGGEAGPEAILPLDTLWTKMREVVGAVIGNNSEEKDETSSTKNKITSVISEKVKAAKKSVSSGGGAGNGKSDRKYHIEKFIVNADMSDADSVSKLMKLLDELDSPEVSPEPA